MRDLIQATTLNSKYIEKYYACERKSVNEVLLITEMTTRGSLNSYLRDYKHPKMNIIQSWFRQVLSGLEYLHSHNIVHGHLSCDNILVNSNSGEVKIGGLMLSKLQDLEDGKLIFRTRNEDIKCFGLVAIEVALMQIYKPRQLRTILTHLYNEVKTGKEVHIKYINDHLYCSLIESCLNATPEITATHILQHPFFTTPRKKDETLQIMPLKPTKTNEKKSNIIDVSVRVINGKSIKTIAFKYDILNDSIEAVANEMRRDLALPEQNIESIKCQLRQTSNLFCLIL